MQVIRNADIFTKARDDGSISDNCAKGYECFTYTGVILLDTIDYHYIDHDESELYLYSDGSFQWCDNSITIAEGTFSYDKTGKLVTLNTGSRYLSSVVLRAARDSVAYLVLNSGSYNFDDSESIDGRFNLSGLVI